MPDRPDAEPHTDEVLCRYELTRSDIRRSFLLQLGVGRPVSFLPAALSVLALVLTVSGGDYRGAMVVLTALGVAVLLVEWNAHRTIRTLAPPLRLVFGPESFELHTGVSDSTVAWAALREVLIGSGHVVLRARAGGGVLVPRRALTDAGLAQVTAWARTAGIPVRTAG